jgi:hypothetical protein
MSTIALTPAIIAAAARMSLTPAAIAVAQELYRTCLSNMGGERLSELLADTYTWVERSDVAHLGDIGTSGWDCLESLGHIQEDEDGNGDPSWCLWLMPNTPLAWFFAAVDQAAAAEEEW